MASYDKQKLQRLLEQKRAAGLQVRDLGDRESDARQEANRLRSIIETSTSTSYAREHGRLAELLTLDIADAARLSAVEIAEYKFNEKLYYSGVEPSTYQKYIAARDKATRIGGERQRAQDEFNSRFAIVASLVDFVTSHGFADPEMEVI